MCNDKVALSHAKRHLPTNIHKQNYAKYKATLTADSLVAEDIPDSLEASHALAQAQAQDSTTVDTTATHDYTQYETHGVFYSEKCRVFTCVYCRSLKMAANSPGGIQFNLSR